MRATDAPIPIRRGPNAQPRPSRPGVYERESASLSLAIAASSPGQATATASPAASPPTTTATAAPATSPAASAATAASASSTTPAAPTASTAAHCELLSLTELGCSGVFPVEDIERRQADVRDFLLTESDFVTRGGVPRRNIRCRTASCRGCTARQRQRHAGDPQRRQGCPPTLSLRSLLRVRHSRALLHLRCCTNVSPP